MKQSTYRKNPIKPIGLPTLWLKYFPINYLRIRTAALRQAYIPDESVVTEYVQENLGHLVFTGRQTLCVVDDDLLFVVEVSPVHLLVSL